MDRPALGAVLLAALLVVGATAPVPALSPGGGATPGAPALAAEAARSGSTVNASVGAQLGTVIEVSSDEVQTDVGNTAFEVAFEEAGEDERAALVAERADELQNRAEAIREDYEAATDAYEAGELTTAEYAQRLATLNARATNLEASYEQLRELAATVSALELRAAGVNRSALDRSVASLRTVTGTGTRALLAQFTGETTGEVELETDDGLSIAVETEDGEWSREFERPRDGDDGLAVSQGTALETARETLSARGTGTWVLTDSQLSVEEGTYEFTFALRGAADRTGEAEVAVDGSSGAVFRLEAEVETRDDDDDEDDGDRELALVLAEGIPAPNQTVVVQVLADGDPAADVAVSLNDRRVGTTDAAGRLTVTLPAGGEVELTAESDEAEGDLEFAFGDGADDEVFRKLAVESRLDGDTVTTVVTYDGAGVDDATVSANDRVVGTTGSDGRVTYTIDANATEELDLEIVKGGFAAELTYTVGEGTLTLTEAPHEADGEDDEESADDAEGDDGDTDSGEATETPTDDEDETDADG